MLLGTLLQMLLLLGLPGVRPVLPLLLLELRLGIPFQLMLMEITCMNNPVQLMLGLLVVVLLVVMLGPILLVLSLFVSAPDPAYFKFFKERRQVRKLGL